MTRRRKFLAAGAALGAASLSGCLKQLNQPITQVTVTEGEISKTVPAPSAGVVQARGEASNLQELTDAEDPLTVGMNNNNDQMVLPASSGDQSVADLHSNLALPKMFQTDAADHIMFTSPLKSAVTGEVVDVHPVNEPFTQSAMTSLSYDRTRTLLDSLKESIGLGFSYPATENEISHPTGSLRTKAVDIEYVFDSAWHGNETPLEPNRDILYLSNSSYIRVKAATADVNQILQDARREILDGILTAVGTQIGLPNAVLDPVFEEIINEAQQHLQFGYNAIESDTSGHKSPVRLSGKFDVQGQTVTFETPFVPIVIHEDDLGAPYKWSLNTDLGDWISEARRVLNVDF